MGNAAGLRTAHVGTIIPAFTGRQRYRQKCSLQYDGFISIRYANQICGSRSVSSLRFSCSVKGMIGC
ncbi:hypothetical protein K439DRAFT_491240 [Ramaria rubella]|nr:hypothetical protein K439DRAFT_696049 [Ramaria rubella]KAF8578264.1 hypothetical protein K439DRAFT_491240 [Ramaria rubella]